MKNLRKTTAIMLTFVMVFSFAACGKFGQNAVGTWSMRLDLTTAMKEEMGSEFESFDTPFVFTVYLDLNKDGSCIMYLDEAEAEKDMETFMYALADFFAEHLSSTKDEAAQKALEAQFGMSIKEYALQSVKQSMNLDDLARSMVQEGVYEIKNGKLFIGSDKVDENIYDLITIDGDKMTLNAAADASASPFLNGTIPGLSFPFEFTRVK